MGRQVKKILMCTVPCEKEIDVFFNIKEQYLQWERLNGTVPGIVDEERRRI